MNEDELADFLDNGRLAAGQGDESTRDSAVRFRDLLADDAVWAEPRPTGVDDLLAGIEAESGGSVAAAARMDRPQAPARARGRRLVLVAAAAGIVVLAGVVGILVRAADDGAGQNFAVAGTELAPGASAVATVEEAGSGVAIELDVSGLPPAEPGTYYQAWVKGPDGLVTVGTFHMRSGDDNVELWSGVPLDRYSTLTVTLQEEGAGQESSGRVVLSGDVRG
ncbi:MAG TPA: anti-sigma factor [Acidimicrobiales bacterium]|nr:anti-sigma factor [Acidimicrobiales bacterium]